MPTASVKKQYPLVFADTSGMLSDKDISADFQLRARQEGDMLLFSGVIDNRSADTLSINPGDLQIETAKGTRTDVAWFDAKKLVVLPNSSDTLAFKFAPINNTVLQERINYRGDMDPVYFITINFIHKNGAPNLFGQRLRFALDSKDFARYNTQFAFGKRLKLFQISDADNLKQALLSNLATLNAARHIANWAGSVNIHGNTINIDGAVISLNFYEIDSALYLQVRITNHGKYILIINPFDFKLAIAGKINDPQMLSINNLTYANGPVYSGLRGGDRLEFKLKYCIKTAAGFALQNDGTYYQDNRKPVFMQPLNFTVENF